MEKEKPVKINQYGLGKRILGAKEFPVFVIVVALFVIMSFLSSNFLSTGNLMTTLLGLSCNGIVAIAMTIILAMGGIDLSVGSVMALSAMVMAKIAHSSGNIWLGAILGLIIAIACGAVNGIFITKVGLTPFIMTLAMMSIARGTAMLISSGKSQAVSKEGNDAFFFFGQGNIGILPVLALLFIIIAVAFGILMTKTVAFRKVFYIGSNENAARLSGINVNATKLGVYILSSCLSGLAGILTVSRFATATTTTGTGVEMIAISAAVIGGASLAGGSGSIVGAVLGILLLNIVDNALVLLRVSVYGQDLISGLILLVAVTMDIFSNKRRAAK